MSPPAGMAVLEVGAVDIDSSALVVVENIKVVGRKVVDDILDVVDKFVAAVLAENAAVAVVVVAA